eukprot:scaffold47_cov258-Pinguiococcus_pyrenoidosus.AAC.17
MRRRFKLRCPKSIRRRNVRTGHENPMDHLHSQSTDHDSFPPRVPQLGMEVDLLSHRFSQSTGPHWPGERA